MKGTNLGEFEELVLLTIASLLAEAYSVAICEELGRTTGRTVRLGVVHAVLHRLEKKGLAQSQLGEPTSQRGGRRKRFYHLTDAGKHALSEARNIREKLWKSIPKVVFDGIR